jgi:hypothetical protein
LVSHVHTKVTNTKTTTPQHNITPKLLITPNVLSPDARLVVLPSERTLLLGVEARHDIHVPLKYELCHRFEQILSGLASVEMVGMSGDGWREWGWLA